MPVGIIALQSKTNLTNVTKTDKLYNERNGADDANILKFSERHILMMSNNDQVPEGIIRYRTKTGDTPGVTDTLALTETDVLTGNSAIIATKHYVDTVASGLDVKQSVKAATTAAVDFNNNELQNGVTIDSYTLVTGDRVLVKDQANSKQNGIYIINATGAPTRANDFITNIAVVGSQSTVPLTENAFFFVENGTLYANTGWTLAIPSGGTQSGNSNVTVDDTTGDDIIFTQFSGAGLLNARDGMSKNGNILDVDRNLQIRGGVINSTPIGVVSNTGYSNSNSPDAAAVPAAAAFTTCRVDQTLDVTGVTTLTSIINANGGIGCDNNAFTVADTSGNTVIAGTLDLNNTADIADTLTLSKASGTGLSVVSNAVIEGTCAITKALTVNGGTTFLVDPDANGDTLINARLEISASKNTNTDSLIKAIDGDFTLDCNAGNLILDGHTGVQIDSTNSGNVEINSVAKIQIGNDDVDQNIEIGCDGERSILIGTASGTGSNPSTLINLNAVNINADSTASISLDSHDDSNFTVDGENKNLTLSVSGGGTQKILIDSAGTGTDAIDINVIGGFDLDAGKITLDSGDNISLDSVNDSNFTVTGNNKTLSFIAQGGGSTQIINQSDGTNNDSIKLYASAGGITGTCNNDKSIILQNIAATTYFKLNSNSSIPASETIELVNNSGTTNSSILLDAKSGGITAKVTDGKDLTLQNTAGDLYIKLAAHSNAAGEDIRIVNTNGTDAKSIELTATAGGITTSCNDDKSIVLQNNSEDTYIKLNGSTTASNETIQIYNSDGTDNASISFTANSGGITAKCNDDKSIILSNNSQNTYIKLNANTTADSETIQIVNADGTNESSLKIESTSGGIDIDAAAGKDIDISGGQINLSSKTNEADAISLTTNIGTSETIVVTNTKGTSNSAIKINSVKGGVDIDADISIALNSKYDSNFIVNGSGDLTLQTTGDISNKLIVNSSGTTADSIDITCDGGINIDADGGIIAIDANMGINIGLEYPTAIDIDSSTFDLNASGAITLDGSSIIIGAQNASALDLNTTTIDIDSSSNISVDSVNGSISIGTILSDAQTLKLGKNGTTEMIFAPNNASPSNEKITLTNTSGTDPEAIYINSITGGIKLNSGTTFDVNSTGLLTLDSANNSISIGSILSDGQTLMLGKSGATQMIFAPHSSTGSEKITLTNTSGTDGEAIYINSVAGGIKLNAGSSFDLDSSGTLNIDSATSIAIGTNADKPIDIDASTFDLDASSHITIDNSAGNISINSANGSFDLDSSDALSIDSTTSINIGTATSGIPISIGHTVSEVTINDNLTVTGNFIVHGSSTQVNSTTITVDDIILTLGGDTAPSSDDGKDRGVEFRYFDGTAKIGFFGYDNNQDLFTYIPDGTNTSEVYAGDIGDSLFKTIYFYDKGNEYISGDGTNLSLVAGTNMNFATTNYIVNTTNNTDINSATFDLDATGAITLTSSSGIMDIDSSGALTIDSATSINIGAANDSTPINIGTSSNSRTITIGNDSSTKVDINAEDIELDAGTNGITLNTTGSTDIVSTGSNTIQSTSTTAINSGSHMTITTTADNSNITIDPNGSGNLTLGSDDNTIVDINALKIELDAGATGTNINSVGPITVTSTKNATDAINIVATVGGIDISASGASAGEDIDIIATGSSVNITSTEDVADSITITSSNGGIDISAAGASAGEDIDITATGSSVNITSTESVPDSITIISANGGIDISATGASAGEDIDITATGSSVNITSTENASDAIKINSTAGSIDIDSASNITVDSTNDIVINSTNGEISIDTGDTTNGIKIATANSGIPISIGHSTSETTINDNLNVSGNLLVNSDDLFVNAANSRIGINESSPDVSLHINSTDSLKIPKGTTAQRPDTSSGSANRGYIRYNTTTDQFEGFGAGDAWGSLGGVIDVDQDTYVSAENSAGADNDELKFYTDGTQQMIIDSTGLVGINRTPDTGKQLDVSGVTRSTSYEGEWLGDTVATNRGGTGQTTYTPGQLLCGTSTGTLAKHTIKAGSNITVANNDNGEITVAAIAVMPSSGEFMYFTSPPFISNNISSSSTFMNLAFMNMDVSFDKYSMQQNVTIDYILLTGSDTHTTASYTVDILKNGVSVNTTSITSVNKVKRVAIGSNLSFSRADELQIKIKDDSGNITGEEVLILLEGVYADIRVGSVFTKSADRLDITYNTGGKVGINNNSPNFTLDVTGTFNCSSDATAASFTSNSDDRMKHNEINIVNALDTIMQLNPQIYNKTTQFLDENYNSDLDELGISYKKESGFIAQEVFNIDELKHNVLEGDDTKPYGLNYSGIIPYNTKAIQELKQKNDDLQTKYDDLETKYNDLLARITALENN